MPHVVYGLQVTADVPLPGLLLGSDQVPIDIRVQLKGVSDFPPAFLVPPRNFLYVSPKETGKELPTLQVGLLSDGKHYGFFYGDGTRFAVDDQGREVWADWPDHSTLEDTCTYLIGPVIAFALRLRGVVCLHASSVAVDGRAIALFGMGGAGKSTTAAAFALNGYAVLSDDVVVLAEQDHHFMVQPGYPRVNLWPDSVHTLFGSENALPRITPTWDKRYMDLGRNGCQFQSSPLPLGAIYILGDRDAKLAAPVIEEVVGGEAIMALVSNTYVNYLLDSEMRAREFKLLSRIMAAVPVRRVRPSADAFKVFELCEMVAADAKRVMPNGSANSAHVIHTGD